MMTLRSLKIVILLNITLNIPHAKKKKWLILTEKLRRVVLIF